MKRSSGDLIIFFCLVLLTIAMSVFAGSDTTEIQFHDTYFVVDRLSLALMTFGPLISIVFLPLAAIRKFQSVGTNVLLIMGLVVVAVICYSAIQLQSNYAQQVEALRNDQLPDRSNYLNNIRVGLKWSRGMLAVIVLPTIMLIYKTVKIWKETHSRPHL